MCFQDVDFARLWPVRYTELNHSIHGLCVSGSWLVVADWTSNTTSLYSLPGLELHDQMTVPWCRLPRADGAGVVYVPAYYHIAVLQITDSGSLTGIRNLSSVGGQSVGREVSVAVGPQPGQLCVGQFHPPRLWVVNASDGSLLHTLTLPDPCEILCSVAALVSGQLIISYDVIWPTCGLAVYRSVTDSPTLLTNLTAVGCWVYGLTGSGNHFLAPYVHQSDLLVLDPDGSVLYTVDAVSGKLGIWLHEIYDVTVWQDCVWMGARAGDMVLLCGD